MSTVADDGVAHTTGVACALQAEFAGSVAVQQVALQSTGNAGGVRNAIVSDSGHSFDELLREMDTGLLVTELMGHGTNLVTGDYSRGAAGFWVEGGEIRYPVEEVTVASNMADMFKGLVGVGTDNDIPGSIDTGSWLVDSMTVAGD